MPAGAPAKGESSAPAAPRRGPTTPRGSRRRISPARRVEIGMNLEQRLMADVPPGIGRQREIAAARFRTASPAAGRNSAACWQTGRGAPCSARPRRQAPAGRTRENNRSSGCPVVTGCPSVTHCTRARRAKARKYVQGSIPISVYNSTSSSRPAICSRTSSSRGESRTASSAASSIPRETASSAPGKRNTVYVACLRGNDRSRPA